MTNSETRNEWRPAVGGRYLAPSGRIWIVRSITARGSRVVMASDSPEGEHGAVVDVTAVSRMIALDAAPSARPAELTSRPPVQDAPTGATVDTLSGAATKRGSRSDGDERVAVGWHRQ